jgi:hypothetical protein
MTVDDAIRRADMIGIPKDFTLKTWDKAVGRGGRDSKEVIIRSWAHYLKAEWNYEQDRLKRQDRNQANGGSGPDSTSKRDTPNYAAGF